MNKVIIRYELARQSVSLLTHKRSTLLSECEGLDTSEDNQTCGREAWLLMEDQNHDCYYDECISFEEALTIYINNEEGACDKCLEAYKIKNNELSKAKKEFGNAKRSLSYHGKKLIKGEG